MTTYPAASRSAEHRAGAPHPLVLVCAADDRYSMPLAVMLYSALANYRGSAPVEIYVLDGGISEPGQRRIRDVLAPFGVGLSWLRPRADVLAALPTGKHFSVSIYFRLLIPELLPPELTRAIYLDSDLIVQGNLALLWEQEVGDDYFLAVRDPTTVLSHLASCPELTIGEEDEYFNSGVLVMNLSRWREDGFGRRAIEFVRDWPELVMHYPDQDALNALALGRWRKLDRVWNQCVASSVAMEEFDLIPGGIVHYIGPVKPWHPETARFRQPADVRRAHRLFERYARESGWFTPAEWRRFIAPLRLERLYLGYVDLPLRVLSLRLRRLAGRPGGSGHVARMEAG